MDWWNTHVILWIMCFPNLALGTVTISFDPRKPHLTESVNIMCTLTDSSSTTVNWNFASTTTSCGSGICVPDPSPHTYSMSGNEYTLTLPSAAIVNCITYSCSDAANSADTTSEQLYVAYFDKAEISTSEPGAGTNGTISVTTGCVLPLSNLTITWVKVLKNGEEEPVTATIDTPDRSTCSRTCHSEEDEKVTNGFTHTEYDSDYDEVHYKVTVTHSSYTDQFIWTTASTYRVKKDSCVCDCECECEVLAILSYVFGILGIILLIGFSVLIWRGWLKKTVLLLLIGIAIFILFIISISFGAAVLRNDDCGCCCSNKDCCEDCCCPDWVGKGATAFLIISIIGAFVATMMECLLCAGVFKTCGIAGVCPPHGNEEGGPDGPDGGHNGGGALMTHARVHAGHEETHRGSLSNRPMPAIPTHQGQDKKGRGLSANFDDDHPMVSISVPEKKAGDLGPLHEEPQKKKKKKKKRTDEE